MSIVTKHDKSQEAHLKFSFHSKLEISENYYKTNPDSIQVLSEIEILHTCILM